MTGFIQEIVNIAEKYSLKVSSIDATDITLFAHLELFPKIYVQVYRNTKKNKLNMALVLGSNRIYGFDSEGRILHPGFRRIAVEGINKQLVFCLQCR